MCFFYVTLPFPVPSAPSVSYHSLRHAVSLPSTRIRRVNKLTTPTTKATASIDQATALEIQQILREEMSESTLITIAHRVEAVRNADYAVVLDKGRVVRAGDAEQELGGRAMA